MVQCERRFQPRDAVRRPAGVKVARPLAACVRRACGRKARLAGGADAVKLPVRTFPVALLPVLVKALARLVRKFRLRLMVGGRKLLR